MINTTPENKSLNNKALFNKFWSNIENKIKDSPKIERAKPLRPNIPSTGVVIKRGFGA